MTSTSIRTGRGVSQSFPGGTRDAGTQALQAAGRELLAAVGNQVLKVAVDRAVLTVDQVAARLDTVAAGGGRTPRSAPSQKPPGRPPDRGEQRPNRGIGSRWPDTVAAGWQNTAFGEPEAAWASTTAASSGPNTGGIG